MNATNGVDPDAVRAHVARITASELFVSAERLCRFLRFTVESKLSGREADVKEYTIGRAVFDRGEDYDPRLDPIVRVEARRLRSRLAEYYGGPGHDESLRLEYRKGSYVPVVTTAASGGARATSAAPARRSWWIAAIVGAIVLIAIGAVAIPRLTPAPMTASIPATWLQPNDGTMDGVDVTLAENVDEGLANQSGSRVVAWPTIAQHPNLRGTDLRDLAARLHASRLVIIMVRDEASTRRIIVFAIDEPEDRKRLALSYYADTSLADLAVQSTYANRIVHDLTTGRSQ